MIELPQDQADFLMGRSFEAGAGYRVLEIDELRYLSGEESTTDYLKRLDDAGFNEHVPSMGKGGPPHNPRFSVSGRRDFDRLRGRGTTPILGLGGELPKGAKVYGVRGAQGQPIPAKVDAKFYFKMDGRRVFDDCGVDIGDITLRSGRKLSGEHISSLFGRELLWENELVLDRHRADYWGEQAHRDANSSVRFWAEQSKFGLRGKKPKGFVAVFIDKKKK